MENPAQHGDATRIIREALRDVAEQKRLDRESGELRAGFSVAMIIAMRLRDAGYLRDGHVWLDDPPGDPEPEPPPFTSPLLQRPSKRELEELRQRRSD